MLWVVIACHFANKNTICPTIVARLDTVLKMARLGDRILVTGDVPYEPGGPTLAELQREYLIKNRFPEKNIETLHGGVCTFDEARLTVAHLEKQGIKNFTVVSSDWYFLQGETVWRRRTKEKDMKVWFIRLAETGGWRTRLFYAAIGAVIRLSIVFGLEKKLEDKLSISQQGRRNGFKMNGCK